MWHLWALLVISASCVPQAKIDIFNLVLSGLPKRSGDLQFIQTAQPVPRQYIVRLEDDAPMDAVTVIEPLLKIVNITITEKFNFPRGFSMVSGSFELPLLLLQKIPFIVSIEEQFFLNAHQVQENPTWSLDRLDFRYSNMAFDQSFVFDGVASNVDIYILDSGVEQHLEFSGRLKSGFSSNGDNKDCTRHGTHVAGIAAGLNVGVAKGANIIPVKVLGCRNETTLDQIVRGINWIIDHKRKNKPDSVSIINMSIGPDGSSKVPVVSNTLDDALRAAMKADLLIVLSAGNENTDICQSSPARVDGVVVVGASDKNDRKANFSNFGSCVSVYAPGISVLSSIPGDKYELRFGTSQAAPHVAGIAALYVEKNPRASLSDIKKAILEAAMPISNSNIRIAQLTSVPSKGSAGAQKIFTNSLRNDMASFTGDSSTTESSTGILVAYIVSGIAAVIIIIAVSSFIYRKKGTNEAMTLTPSSSRRKLSKPVLPFHNDSRGERDIRKPLPTLNPYTGPSLQSESGRSRQGVNYARKPSISDNNLNQARKPSAGSLPGVPPRKLSSSSTNLHQVRKPSVPHYDQRQVDSTSVSNFGGQRKPSAGSIRNPANMTLPRK